MEQAAPLFVYILTFSIGYSVDHKVPEVVLGAFPTENACWQAGWDYKKLQVDPKVRYLSSYRCDVRSNAQPKEPTVPPRVITKGRNIGA